MRYLIALWAVTASFALTPAARASAIRVCGFVSASVPYSSQGHADQWRIYLTGPTACVRGREVLNAVLHLHAREHVGRDDAHSYSAVGAWICPFGNMGFQSCHLPMRRPYRSEAIAIDCAVADGGCPKRIPQSYFGPTLASAGITPRLNIDAPASLAKSLPQLFTDEGFTIRPRSPIHLSGDSTLYFAGYGGFTALHAHAIDWRHWTSREALGRGELYANNCQPNCARGSFIGYRGTVRASNVKPRIFVGFSGTKFVRLSITFRQTHTWTTVQFHLIENTNFTGWQTNTILRIATTHSDYRDDTYR